MARRVSEKELVIASHNAGKVREIGELLAPYGISVKSATELNLEEPEETGATFVENAELKARAAASVAKKLCLADDSGLVVPALGGAPGIYSARWADGAKDFRKAMDRIERELTAAGTPMEGAEAYFICVLSLCWPDGHCESFEGRVDGMLTYPPLGDRGFGYDPIFVAEGQAMTFGEMLPDMKDAISHRADAFRKLVAACFPPDA
jgi:XTP/dITP diphosphohydrolase